jgi:hypothetical protein
MKYKMLQGIFALALILGCDSTIDPKDNDYSINVKFVSDSAMEFGDSSYVKIRLYGYSERVADAPATKLKSITYKIDSLAQTFSIQFNESDFNTITFKSGEANEFNYYLHFEIDVDNDSKIGHNDFIQDYTKSEFTSYSQSDKGFKELTFYLDAPAESSCTTF